MHPSSFASAVPAQPSPSALLFGGYGLKTIASAMAALGGVGVIAIGSTSADLPVLCVFRRCTGGYCPGCGGTRAVASLAKGDLAGAWTQHPWVVLLAAQLIVVVGAALSGRLRLTNRLRNRLLIANTFLGIAIWIVRLAAGQIPIPGLPYL